MPIDAQVAHSRAGRPPPAPLQVILMLRLEPPERPRLHRLVIGDGPPPGSEADATTSGGHRRAGEVLAR